MQAADFKAARLKLGLDQADAARLLGYGAKTRISEIETGSRAPGPAVVLLLKAYLAGYRPAGWPERCDTPPAFVPVAIEPKPVDPATARKVADAMRRGLRRAGDIARETRLGLLTVQDAMRYLSELPPPPPPESHRGRRKGR
ncbi:MAG: helix-turn-helix domain-containing protein [Methylocystis sp.]|nr:helix-turn-helix domain-containing protein [Rhodobacter sp.]MCA3586034.1 helix-turn-helix domain-containing protein [Methylocystis sp.]MCA3461543.1 helix-turn-helix domain-containing protein [Rhodobacter sp.]MCA3464469.1 helix-turn-helix domain-containing protein [Rhodobacter sp.]MCA3466278.1 helix-turn-helix domain-containing protein [Rhodobacter sp.]